MLHENVLAQGLGAAVVAPAIDVDDSELEKVRDATLELLEPTPAPAMDATERNLYAVGARSVGRSNSRPGLNPGRPGSHRADRPAEFVLTLGF